VTPGPRNTKRGDSVHGPAIRSYLIMTRHSISDNNCPDRKSVAGSMFYHRVAIIVAANGMGFDIMPPGRPASSCNLTCKSLKTIPIAMGVMMEKCLLG